MPARLQHGVQELMREAPSVISVVEACTLSGRQERLDALLQPLELCEKALQVPPKQSVMS